MLFVKCLYLLLLLLAVLEVTSAITPLYSTHGKRFVFSFPLANPIDNTRGGHVVIVRCITEEEQASVVLTYPANGKNTDAGFKEDKRFVRKDSSCEFLLITWARENGIYVARKLEADAPVGGVVYIMTKDRRGAMTIRLLPQQVWSTSYYVSTSNTGHPFMMIMTLDVKVKAKLHFPNNEKNTYFNVTCSASRNKNCTSGSNVTVIIPPCKVWQLFIKEKGVCFHNALIEADHPVYVIAGTIGLQYPIGGVDAGACSIRPPDTWGKEYLLPTFKIGYSASSTTSYRITAKKIPFHYKLYQNGKETKKQLSSQDTDDCSIAKFTSPVILRAKVPFAVYQFVAGPGLKPGMLGVVPTEQWSNGGSYFKFGQSGQFEYRRFIFTTTVKKTCISVYGGGKIAWEPVVKYGGRIYNYGELTIHDFPVSVFSKEPNGRLVIYKVVTASNHLATAYYSMSSHYATIYQADCNKTDPLYSDGFDNDCDGFVDEEWKNDKDDDGDGLIDEDYILAPNIDPEWTAWTTVCRIKCRGKELEKTVRDCKLGKYVMETACDGVDETCDSREKCPKYCRKDIASQCSCQSICKTCVSTTSLRCSECRDGYQGTHCLIPCPDGWRGRNCSIAPGPKDLPSFASINVQNKGNESSRRGDNDDDEEEEETLSVWLWVGLGLIVIVAIIGLVIPIRAMLRKRKVPADTNDNDNDENINIESVQESEGETEVDSTMTSETEVETSVAESEVD